MLTSTVTNAGDALLNLLQEVLLWIPRVLVAAVILLIGWLIARLAQTLVAKGLRLVHFDDIADRAGITNVLRRAGTSLDAAGVLGAVAFWWILLAFFEMAVDSLGLTQITAFISNLLGYLPNVFVAILIIIVGSLIANVVAGIVRGSAGEAGLTATPILAGLARWAILLFAVLAALAQLNVAQNMIFILFAAFTGMIALAGGLALGLGGVDTARGLIAGWAMGRVLQPGSQVRIGDQSGRVVRHDLNATVLDTGSGQVTIPNADLSRERVMTLGPDSMGNGVGPRQPASSR